MNRTPHLKRRLKMRNWHLKLGKNIYWPIDRWLWISSKDSSKALSHAWSVGTVTNISTALCIWVLLCPVNSCQSLLRNALTTLLKKKSLTKKISGTVHNANRPKTPRKKSTFGNCLHFSSSVWSDLPLKELRSIKCIQKLSFQLKI